MATRDPRAEPGRPRHRTGPQPLSPEEVEDRRLVQELQLHKIELEMQNEELRRVLERLETSREQASRRVAGRAAELSRAIESLSEEVQVRHRAELILNGALMEMEAVNGRLEAENRNLRLQMDWRGYELLTGTSAAVARLREEIQAAAALEGPVLLLGETGTGKGMAARVIHGLSARRHRPLVPVGCATLPEDHLARLLQGGGRGARNPTGLLDLADHGILFLEQVGALSPEAQAGLLQVVRARCLGPRPVLRVIAASNRDLEEAVRQGWFRKDLHACLSGCTITLPPLRQRREDIPCFVEVFLARFNRILGKAIHRASDRALDLLQARTWPGNLRELEGAIELAMITSPGPVLELPERGQPD